MFSFLPSFVSLFVPFFPIFFRYFFNFLSLFALFDLVVSLFSFFPRSRSLHLISSPHSSPLILLLPFADEINQFK